MNNTSRSIQTMISATPSPVFRSVKTNGRSPLPPLKGRGDALTGLSHSSLSFTLSQGEETLALKQATV
jgi:hypothetical protein